MRININLSDELKYQSEQKAKYLGVSLSAFVRLLLTREAGQMSELDQRLIQIEKDGFEKVDYQDFKADLQNMIKDADA
ncbi:MAG: CopG family transcriptional regulator [Kangiella sp.]|nr:MAG: CopG family transcriptional regulator [Kangiella sp.]PHS19881.1 MAG: CopG family transcriptional regulator [Kangiella sp.]